MSGNRRLASCVANWPEAEDGAYNLACCRFPKSCSPYPYAEQIAAGADLEPAVTAPKLTAAEAARVAAIEAAPAAEESFDALAAVRGTLLWAEKLDLEADLLDQIGHQPAVAAAKRDAAAGIRAIVEQDR